MDLYQPIAKAIVLPLHAWKTRSKYLRYLAEFEKTQYLGREAILQMQWSGMRRIVQHAYEHCPYYRRKYDEAGFHPRDLKEPGEFRRIPVLSKEEIQRHCDEMLADNIPRDRLIKNFTGGSTGKPLPLYHDLDRDDSRRAGTIRHNRWAGLDLGDKVACLWGATRDIPSRRSLKSRARSLLIERTLFLDTSLVSRETLDEFVDRLSRFRPRVFLAYAGSLALFAQYVRERKLEGTIVPQGIISSAEVLTDENRRLVESVFRCPVFDRYACREASMLASECESHEGMHINAESVYLEFSRGQTAAAPGEIGEILLTDLRNRAMPLIRYQIGDVGVPSEHECRCGRGLPLMQITAGRVTDFIVTAEGDLVSGVVLSTYLITKVSGLNQVQFYQERRGELVVRLVPAAGPEEIDLDALNELIVEFLGRSMKVEFEFVDGIPKEASGKYRFTISKLSPLDQLT